MSFTRSVFTVGGLTLVSRVLGFVRDVLSTAILGAGPIADAALVAFRLPNLFRRLFAEGAFSAAFVPMFSARLEDEGRDAAADFAEQAQAVMLLVLTPLTIAAIIFMPQVMTILAPGFDHNSPRYDLAVALARITFPYLILISISALQGGVLNALDRYGPLAFAPVLFNVCLILGFALTPFLPTPGHALAYGEALAGVVQVAWMLRACRRAGILLKLRRPRFTPLVKRLFTLMGPVALGAGAAQVNIYVDQIIASYLPQGAISYLYYADRLNQLPLGIIGIAVGTALLPLLSRHAKAHRWEELREATARAIEMSLLLALPAAVALMVAARPIMEVLFVRGAFTQADALQTARGLTAYSLGIPAYVLAKILSTGFYARQDTKTPVKFSMIAIAANTALSLSTIHWLGFVGIALATGITAWLNTGLLAWKLHQFGLLSIDARLRRTVPRLLAASLVMAAALHETDILFRHLWLGSLAVRGAALLALVTLGGATYFAVIFAMGVFNLSEIRSLLKRGRSKESALPARADTL